MAYDPYKYIKDVFDAKVGYGNATTDTERQTYNATADKARQMLRDNGHGDIADSISADGATAEKVKGVMDKFGKLGKTATRDYMYSLGKAYGLNSTDVDKLISWDDVTGEVSFGGKKIGTPDSVVDGVSYWSDPSVLDSAFKDYAHRSGLTRPTSAAVSQENEKLFDKYGQEYDYLLNTSPFETDLGKSILEKYDLAGLKGRENEMASGAGSNGGNIDSFAAANALRQQTELINQGKMVALDAHQQRLDHARGLLSDMGINIDRVFNQGETKRINDANIESQKVDDNVKIAGVTGYVPVDWEVIDNQYVNADGTIKEKFKDTDFGTLMKIAKDSGNEELYRQAGEARWYKINGNRALYGQFDDGNYIVPTRAKTQAAKQHDDAVRLEDKSIDSALEATKLEGQNAKESIKLEGDIQKGLIDAQADANIKQVNAGLDANGKPVDDKDGVSVFTWPSDFTRGIHSKHEFDEFGESLLADYMKNYPADISVDNFLAFAVENSATHHVDLRQLKLVCKYLGFNEADIKKHVTDKIENAGESHIDGVKWKEK